MATGVPQALLLATNPPVADIIIPGVTEVASNETINNVLNVFQGVVGYGGLAILGLGMRKAVMGRY